MNQIKNKNTLQLEVINNYAEILIVETLEYTTKLMVNRQDESVFLDFLMQKPP